MRRLAHRRARLLATVAWLTAAVASAPRPAQADAAQARIHFDKGRTYFEVDEYRKAIEEFKAAHVERADPAFLYNIAECYRRLGETRDALVYYRRFLSLAPANDRTRPTVEKRIAELQKTEGGRGGVRDSERSRARASAETTAATAPSPPPAPAPVPAAEPAATLVQRSPAPAPVEPTPIYRKGWFIATVAAVVVAGAVGVWALSRGPDIPDTALGNQPIFR